VFLADFLFVLLLALLFTGLFAFATGVSMPRPSLVWLFATLFLGTWALGVWFRPIGPPMRGVYWASFLAAIVVVSLLLVVSASAPRLPRRKSREELKGVELRPITPAEEQVEKERAQQQATASLGFLFWLLTAVAVAALLVHYVFPGRV